MHPLKKILFRAGLFNNAKALKQLSDWITNKYSSPSPHFIKQAVILRNSIPNATWIETGTYMGDTTRLLAKQAKAVYSIEPEPTLFKNAKTTLSKFQNIEILHGASEDVFPQLLNRMNGDINFWLDGHFSGVDTYESQKHTPIIEELNAIGSQMSQLGKISVLVDDIRCFNPHLPQFSGYPSIDFLVDWARKYNLKWHIEHDIFIARNN